MGSEESPVNKVDASIVTEFDGYVNLELNSKVIVLGNNEEFKAELKEGEEGFLLTDKTPFYAEMGGQVGDRGNITSETGMAIVTDCKKNVGGKFVHYIKVIEGSLKEGQEVKLSVDASRRSNICKNHTATHMLHEALKEVLGDHVNQSGSYVDEERLRFDFTHFAALTEEELEKVELLVNEKIMTVSVVDTKEMSLDEARNSGATCLFDEKYAEKSKSCFSWRFLKRIMWRNSRS